MVEETSGEALRACADPLIPAVQIQSCPIAVSLGVLGRKWSILILRDIGMRKMQRFNELLKANPGLTPRILSMRLRELESEGYIERVERRGPNLVRWALTEKGSDTIPILMQFVAFGSKWYAERVFGDGAPRTLKEIYPHWSAEGSWG